MTTRKVFGIGFQKTGTTTLGVIFDRLGYRTAGYHQFRHLADRETLGFEEVERLALEIARDVDAAKDTPWPILYRSLDREFPGSKFIHVTRDPDAWIRSAVKDFGSHPNALREVIYGSRQPVGHEAEWVARYKRHNDEVRAYFADRPDDCLFLSLEEGGVSFESGVRLPGREAGGHGHAPGQYPDEEGREDGLVAAAQDVLIRIARTAAPCRTPCRRPVRDAGRRRSGGTPGCPPASASARRCGCGSPAPPLSSPRRNCHDRRPVPSQAPAIRRRCRVRPRSWRRSAGSAISRL